MNMPKRLSINLVKCSDLKDPDYDDGLGVEERGGRHQQVQAGREEDGRPKQPVGGEPGELNRIKYDLKKGWLLFFFYKRSGGC